MNVELAVIIVSFNTIALLRACLRSALASLDRTPGLTFQIVVADNGSSDGSRAMVEAEFPMVTLLDLVDNVGFGAANNAAARVVESKYVLFLNPDTEVLGDAPGALLNFLVSRPDVGLVGAHLLNPDLSFQHSCFTFPTIPMVFLDYFPLNHRLTSGRVNGRYPRSRYSRPFQIDHPLGAFMLVRRDVFDQLGGFDESYFMYSEEVDLCYRLKSAGWKIYYCPRGEVIHHAAASSRQLAGPMLVELHRSRDRFNRSHRGWAYAWLARQIVRLGMATAARRARHDQQLGRIDADELGRRLRVYDDVIA